MVCSAQPWGSLRREATPPGDKAPSEPIVSKGSEAVTLTKLLKSPSGTMLGSELPGISKVRPRLFRGSRL